MTDARARSLPIAGLSLIRRAVTFEVNMWRSLYRWILRRPVRLEPGDEAFSYAGVVTPVLGVFIGLSAVEIPILDLILRHVLPWQSVRFLALGLGIYGLFWMIGLMASLRVHPHVVGPAGLRVRNSNTVDIRLPWTAVETIHARYRSLPFGRSVQLEEDGPVRILHIGVGSQTSIDVVLRQPTSVLLPKGPSEPVDQLRFFADRPDTLVARARRYLAASGPDNDADPAGDR